MPAYEAHGPAGPPGGELTAILAEVTGPGGQFRHRQHINLAFLAVRRYGMPEATARICGWIRHIAAYQRAPQKYHHTVSRAWVEIVAHHVAADPDCADFETFAGRHLALLDKRLLSRHYRSSTLAAAPARQGWVEPDLLPFPWTPLFPHRPCRAAITRAGSAASVALASDDTPCRQRSQHRPGERRYARRRRGQCVPWCRGAP